MHTGDTGGERGLEGTGAQGDWRKNLGNSFAGSKSVTNLRNAPGEIYPRPKNDYFDSLVMRSAHLHIFYFNNFFHYLFEFCKKNSLELKHDIQAI
jgi:hypothetical protein